MFGEPVWCVEEHNWGIIKMETVGRWANTPFFVGVRHYNGGAVTFELDIRARGLTLYRHKPNIAVSQKVAEELSKDPLALEELLELEGLPVWVVPVSKDADWDPCWVIFDAEFMFVPSKSSKTMVYALYAHKNYKWKWLAYRNKTSNRTLEHDLKHVVSQDDLSQMINCPIWIVPLGENPEWNPCWTICGNDYSLVSPESTKNGVWLTCKNNDYGKTWLAYPTIKEV